MSVWLEFVKGSAVQADKILVGEMRVSKGK